MCEQNRHGPCPPRQMPDKRTTTLLMINISKCHKQGVGSKDKRMGRKWGAGKDSPNT